MLELMVVSFGGSREKAAQVLNQLRTEAQPWTQSLHGASVVYRDPSGKLTVDESFESTKGNDAIVGGLSGSMLGLLAAVMTIPVLGTAAAVGAMVAGSVGGGIIGAHHRAAHVDAEASWWREQVKLSSELATEVQAAIGPNDSAIVCLRRAPGETEFARFGATVRSFPLTAEQAAVVKARLG